MQSLFRPDNIATIVIWIGAICTLGLYSILYRENKVFRFFEHLYIGLGVGYGLVITWTDVLKPRWWDPMVREGHWWWAAAIPAGLLFYAVYSRRNAWMSRLIFGFFFGLTAGQAFQRYAAVQFPLIRSAVNAPLIHPKELTDPGHYWMTPISAPLNNLIGLVIVVSVMSYFFFSYEQKNRAVAGTSKLGRCLLMFAFGAIFGSTIMARLSLLIGRAYFLLHDWLHLAS